MGIINYFKDNLELEKRLDKCKTKKEVIETVLKSKFIENLNKNIFILNRDISYEKQVENRKKEYWINVNFNISLGLREKEQGSGIYRDLHSHNYIEMIYVYEGTYSQIIDGENITLKTGECCLLNKNIKHKDFTITKGNTVLFLSFSNEFIEDQLKSYIDNNQVLKSFFYSKDNNNNRKEQYILFKDGDHLNSNKIIKKIIDEYFNQDLGSNYIILGYLIKLLQNFTYGDYKKKVAVCEKHEGNNLFANIEKYIEDNISDISREKIAEHLHYNPNYINTVIRRNTNLSYSDYVINKRLEITIKLLRNSDYSINKIIKEVGYINKSYFYKIFVSRYGMKPNEFRKMFSEKI